MRAIVSLLALGCVAASGGSCASCAAALDGTVKMIDAASEVDREHRRRAIEARNELGMDEVRVRLATAELRARAQELQAELAARAEATPGFATGTVVALFEVDGEVLEREDAVEVSKRLHVELAAAGTLRLVPHAAVEDALARSVDEGFGPCFDDACRLELGKALAAEKVLVPLLVRAGERCVLGLEVYDLEREVAEWATSVFAPCTPEALGTAAAVIASRLGGLERPHGSRPGNLCIRPDPRCDT